MKMRDLVFVWVGANAYLFFFSVGVIAFGLGLNIWQAILAVLVGNALFVVRGVGLDRRACAPGCRR